MPDWDNPPERHRTAVRLGRVALNFALWDGLRSQVARSATIYLFSYAVSLGVPFFLLPVMTRFIDPDGYGHLAMFQMLLTTVAAFIGFSLRDPIIRVFSVQAPQQKAQFLSSSLVIMTTVFLAVAVVTMVGRHAITNFTDLSGRWIMLSVIAGFAYVISQTNFTTLQANRQPLIYAAGQIFFSLLSAAVSIVVVVGLKGGWSGRAMAVACVALASGAWGMLRFSQAHLIKKVDRESLREAFTFGAATLPYMLSMMLAAFTDRIFLRIMFSFQDIGVYTVAVYLALGFAAVGDALNLAVIPWAYRQLARLDNLQDFFLLAKRTVFLMTAMVIFALLYFLIIREYVRLFMPARYSGALVFLPWLVADAWSIALFQTVSVGLFHYRKKATLSYFGAGALLCCALLVYMFTMAYGPLGAAIGLFVTHIGMLAILLPVTSYFVVSNLRQASPAPVFP